MSELTEVTRTARTLAQRIKALPARDGRVLIALAGPPGAGKSTLAEALVAALGPDAVLMPMDGFHLDNRLLEPRGLLPRKGAPETFDAAGFCATVARLRHASSVVLPVFDRRHEIAIAGASEITPATNTVVIEGNYLLLNEEPWNSLAALWDVSVFLDVPEAELERRLIGRWLSFGHAPEVARAKAEGNDLPNARRVLEHRLPADVTLAG